MTHDQYKMVKRLKRVMGIKRFCAHGSACGIMTKQAEVEMAGQQAVNACFLGRYRRAVDGRGRVRFPSDWRRILGNDSCIYVLPDTNGAKELVAITAADYRMERDSLSATRVEIASDGRFLFPAELLSFAGIGRSVVLLGDVRIVRMVNPEYASDNYDFSNLTHKDLARLVQQAARNGGKK